MRGRIPSGNGRCASWESSGRRIADAFLGDREKGEGMKRKSGKKEGEAGPGGGKRALPCMFANRALSAKLLEIPGTELHAKLKRSDRRSLSVEVDRNGEILVRAPLRLSERQIHRFLWSRADWIISHQEKRAMEAEQRRSLPPIGTEELRRLADQAEESIPERVRYYAERIGVDYGRIRIRNQQTRWGSCTAAGNLSFNCLLMLCPLEVLDYVVVHELCHRREMNHSPHFWALVEEELPDYRERRDWLRVNGAKLIGRMKG